MCDPASRPGAITQPPGANRPETTAEKRRPPGGEVRRRRPIEAWTPISSPRRLRERLLAAAGEPDGPGGLPQRIRALVDREAGVLDAGARAGLAARIAERAFGLGPLEPLLADPAVEEVMVSGTGPVWVERGGPPGAHRPSASPREPDLRDAIERILAPLGRASTRRSRCADARLPDGSRVNVVIPPLALDGPVLTIRRFRRRGLAGDGPGRQRHPRPPAARLPRRAPCAPAARSCVCGGTGSGKTTTLNALSGFIGERERVVTIEDAAELRLRQPHVVRLEARPPSVEGRGEVTIRRLVRNALRMRPDRIVVGEVRGARRSTS